MRDPTDLPRAVTTARTSTASALPRAKVCPPGITDHYLRRPRLLELLDDVARAPLTLVIAPAGAGKTSLVAGWIAAGGRTAAWFCVDENDRDLVRFWAGLVSALDTVFRGSGAGAFGLLRRAACHDEALDQLLHDLDSQPRDPTVLVVDDLQYVAGHDAIAASLARFVRHLPPWLHIVLVSRQEVPLPVDRMRSRGQLGEIRFADLRFSPEEAATWLTLLAPELPPRDIAAAVERADGWAASLRFSALAARHARAQTRADAAALDLSVLVHDYLVHEVLAGEPEAVLDVLSAAAIVSRINPSLAQAVTGRPDAGDLLRTAEAHGLFLTRVGTSGWFELHAPVRGALHADLAARAPAELARFHEHAARWLEEADEPVEALDQWIMAGQPGDALRLLATTHAELYDRGHADSVRRIITAIPPEIVADDPAAMAAFAWCHLLVNRRRFVELVGQLVWWVERSAPTGSVRARVTMLQSWAETISGRWVEGGELTREAMEHLGTGWWQDPLGRFGWNLIARDVALSERWDDACPEVRQAELALSRDPQRRLAFEGTRALGHVLAGRPFDALRVAAGVRRGAAVAQMSTLRTELRLAEALAHRELGDRTRARVELTELAEEPAETTLYCRLLARLELARMHLDQGEHEAAVQAFDDAEALMDTEGFDGSGWLARVGVLLALAGGDLATARAWAESERDPFWQAVSLARILLATGERPGAVACLDTAVPRCPRHEVVVGLLGARTVVHSDDAAKLATNAVEVAARHGLLQTVASEGPDAIELVEHAAWRVPAGWMDRLRRTAAETMSGPRLDRPDLVEPLTDRELDVLRLLPSRLTVREIADELYVSMNTVKFHLRVIYRKLGVNSRAEAAALARRTTFTRR